MRVTGCSSLTCACVSSTSAQRDCSQLLKVDRTVNQPRARSSGNNGADPYMTAGVQNAWRPEMFTTDPLTKYWESCGLYFSVLSNLRLPQREV
eukprot:2370033-Amphidinium_carterae.1